MDIWLDKKSAAGKAAQASWMIAWEDFKEKLIQELRKASLLECGEAGLHAVTVLQLLYS